MSKLRGEWINMNPTYKSKFKEINLNLIKESKSLKMKKEGSKNCRTYSLKEIDFQEILRRASCSRRLLWKTSFHESSEVVQLFSDFLCTRLKKQLSKYKLPILPDEILKNIVKKIPHKLRTKWADCCDSLLEEVREEYLKVSSMIVLDTTLAYDELDFHGFNLPEDKHKVHISLTKCLAVDMLKCNFSRENIFYYYPFIRQLIAEAQNLLPNVFIDCSKYSGFKGFYHQDILLGIMEKEIDREDLRMEYDWFGKLFLHVSEKNFFLDWNEAKITKFINLIIQITKTIALDRIYDTLRALEQFFTDPKTTPKIAVNVYYSFDGSIVIFPTAADIYKAYGRLIKRVYEMGKNFVHFEMFHIRTGRRGNITLEKYDNVRDKYEQNICEFVTQIYQQLIDYYNDISGRFIELLDDNQTSSVRLSSMNMEELISMADRYLAIKGCVNELELNSYFPHFKAHNKPLIKTLLFISECRINQIMNEVLKFHVEYCERNCDEFYKISLQAVKVPETTEELIKLAKLMGFISTEHMGNMRQNIINYLELFYRVMEIITVPQTYLEMMGLVLRWVYYMGTVIKENAVLLEATKFEFNERLNQVTDKLNEDLENFSSDELDGLDHLDNYAMINIYALHIMKCLRKIQHFDETAKWINKEEILFEMTLSTYPELDEIKAFVNPFARLIFQLYKCNIIYQNIMDCSLENLTVESVEEILEKNNHLVDQLQKWFKSKIRQQTNENNPRRFKGLVDDSEYDNWPAPLKLLHGAQQNLKEIKKYKRLISILCNPRMTMNHWEEISKITGRDMSPYKGSSLRQFINFKVDDKMEQLQFISNSAIKEYHIQENLYRMKMEWRTVSFLLSQSDITSNLILGSVDHIQSLIDDHLVKTLSLRSSAFVKPIEEELRKWYEQLTMINLTVDEWCCLQKKWLHLLPIFSTGDITEYMPMEGKTFSVVDSKYRSLLQLVKDNPLVLSVTNDCNLLSEVKTCLLKLEDINAGVKKYLDKKRQFFTRFFFISDRDMLMMLSERQDARNLQGCLDKCFTGISKLGFDSLLNIYSMYNFEQEEITFVSKVSTSVAGGSVEKWLVQVEDEMIISVRKTITSCLADYKDDPQNLWLKSWPAQIILCVSKCYWTEHIHNCFYSKEPKAMENYYKRLMDQIKEVIHLLHCPTTSQRRRTLSSFIIQFVHSKDLCYILWKKKVRKDSDFFWISQIRYYWEGEINVRALNATIKYGYEYLDSPCHLVVTALTGRCYNALINAFHLHYNGAAEGHSGTGKTETIKDLAKTMGVQCRVFNCSPGLGVLNMVKFLKGLTSSGSWVCFHDFDRISIKVLSVISQHILSIMQAKRNNLAVFSFAGYISVLNPLCFICITTNPNTYGRNTLPSNLKVLFRSVAMIVPDFILIVQTVLYSRGFEKSKSLSTKILATFKLCVEQLSPQTHYDYGMKDIKAVLELATNLKLKENYESEEKILMASIYSNILPKLLFQDIILFNGIMKDVFPNLNIYLSLSNDLFEDISKVCRQKNLQPTDAFVGKIIHTYEIMMAHHSIMLIGDTLRGKSTIIQVLSEVFNCRENRNSNVDTVFSTKIQIINPKAVSVDYLFGYYHPETEDWIDGITGNTFREYAIQNTQDRKWIIFDGPITTNWAENLNTALGENKTLCLNSGEIIKITSSMKIIFECMDLLQASPAIISKCGMVYVDPNSLGWVSIVKSWNNTIPQNWTEDKPDRFITLLEWLIQPCLNFIKKQCCKLTDAGDLNSVRSVCQLIEIMLHEALDGQDLKYINAWSQAVVMLSVLWSIAGPLDSSSREIFDSFYRNLWQGQHTEDDCKPYSEEIDISLPNEGLLEDNTYSFKGKGNWKYWPEVLKVMKLDDIFNCNNNMVTTVESLKYMFIMELFIKHRKSFLLSGPSGTGKSFFIHNLLWTNLSTNDFVPAYLRFTASSTSYFIQKIIISKLVKRTKSTYGPTNGKVCIMFIDDLNMPQSEDNTKSVLELLRQFFDYGHWYDLKTQEKLFIQDLFFVGAMGLKNHSSQPLSPRFLRHFTLLGINMFSDESVTKIFTTTLFIGLKQKGFPTDVMGTVQQIVAATMYLYSSVTSFFLPTPTRCHYVFNIRDLIRTFQGILLIRKESVDGKKVFVRIWFHEILRVFSDRLVDFKDKEWLVDKLQFAVVEYYKEEFEVMLDGLELNEEKQVSLSSLSNLIFTTALDAEGNDFQKYEEASTFEHFYNIAFKTLEEYNTKNKRAINIILFRFALEHLSRVCRIISVPFGNGLLVGVNGSGRQSLVKLGAAMLHQDIFQSDIVKNFCPVKWRSIFKNVLKDAGARNKNCVFLLNESDTKIDDVLQDIDSILSTGEVPMLYTADEIQEIVEMVRLAAQGGNKDIDVSPLAVSSFYINRCKRNLHILLCFSPIGPDLRNRIRLYPALVNCCTIDWFETSWTLEVNGRKLETTGWPEDALECVAKEYILDIDVAETIKTDVVNICKYFHVSARNISDRFHLLTARRIYVTSSAFIDLLKHYNILVKKKKDELELAKEKYLGGLEKLEFAANQVEVMQKDLESLQPALKKAAEETSEMLKVIETETFEVEKASERVRNDEEIANYQAMGAMELKTECENDLASAIPILEDAIAALNTLKPADITLVKSMKNPPETVKLVLAAVCVMKGIKPDRLPDPKNPGRKINDYWGPSKRLLGDMSFLQQLKDYDKDNIPPNIMKAVRSQYLNHKDFKPKVVAKASSAAEGLCKWVIALDKYDVVVKEVAPKKEKLKIAEKEYSETMSILEEKRNLLKGLEDKLAELKENLREANERKIRLQNEVVLCSNKLQKAQRIIGSLGGEKERWVLVSNALQKQYLSLPGDILVSCGIIVYLGPFTPSFRKDVIDDWICFCSEIGIPLSEDYALIKALGSNVLIESWNINGLPNDPFSIDNAILLHTSQKWPLLIDPQNQASKWVKNMEKENELNVVRLSEDYVKIVLRCVQMGKALLLENVLENLDHELNPILEKEMFQHENKSLLKLYDSVVEYHPNFRFYITTKIRNPHFSPEVYKKVVVINFGITEESLSDKLLGIVVSKERPEMQLKRQNLIKESAKNKQDLYAVEDSILKTLSSVRGNILEDENAVNILDSSKIVAEGLKKKEDVAKEIRINIENIWLKYKPIADHVAALYCTVTNLAALDPMYQYSLNWFIKIFIDSIHTAVKCSSIQERIKNLKETFNYKLFINVSYTLFNKDRIVYSFVLCKTLLLIENKLSHDEFEFFLGKRNLKFSEKNIFNYDKKFLLPQKSWESICYLDNLPSFNGLVDDINEKPTLWSNFCSGYYPKCEELPSPWNKNLNSFQKLILLQAIRPDQLTSGMIYFIREELGDKFLQAPPFDLNNAYEESNRQTPLIFILTSESDSMDVFLSFARNKNKTDKLKIISLGENQEHVLKIFLKETFNHGGWLCLQNCHLAPAWLLSLERIINGTDMEIASSEFRLWMTTISSVNFPVSILESGVKIIIEGPTGLKNNLLERYYSEPMCKSMYYESCPGKEQIFTRLLYGISFFHSIVRERNTFGPTGWSNSYDFNEYDYITTVLQLQKFLSEYEEIPLEVMRYLIGECNYGGKMLDEWDKRILKTLLKRFVNKEIIFNEEYSVYKKKNSYCLPVRNGYKDFILCIKNLPPITHPEVYGLNSNGNVKRNLNISNIIHEGLLMMFGDNSLEEYKTSDSIIFNIAEDILLKMPEPFTAVNVFTKFPNDYDECMNTVLLHEMLAFNYLQDVIKSTLKDLLNAIKGLTVLTPDLEEIFNSLISSLVPKVWQNISYSSFKPLGSYITDLIQRVTLLQNWCDFGKPKDFWISGFYFPHSFVSAIKLEFVRKRKISVTELAFDFEILKVRRAEYHPEDGAFVYGICLDGARWDGMKNCLEEELPMKFYDQLPLLWIKPGFRTEINLEHKYICPLYRTKERKGVIKTIGLSTNYILPVLLDTSINPSHWVTRGVALVCQLDI